MNDTFIKRKFMRAVEIFSLYKDLSKFSNIYKGKRCFIIGNGPSLKNTNLKLLKNEFTFGLNRIYLNYSKMGFETTFLVAINDLVITQFHKEIKNTSSIKFLNSNHKELFPNDKNTHFVKPLNQQKFYSHPYKGMWTGHTVTFVAMQLAYFMGFETVYLVGVDHSFVYKGKSNKTQVLKSNDKNHFSTDYFKGHKWQTPDLKMSEKGYQMARIAFEKDDRQIVDATIGGKLKVFKKVDYNSLFLKK